MLRKVTWLFFLSCFENVKCFKTFDERIRYARVIRLLPFVIGHVYLVGVNKHPEDTCLKEIEVA